MMKTWTRKILALLLLLIIIAGQAVVHANTYDINELIKDTGNYVYKRVKEPQIDSVGGEWVVIGLARSGMDIPHSYFENYYANVEQQVKSAKGILHDKKYSEYSRVILGLTAAGYDPTDVAGYDLTMTLADFEKTVWQGINGPIYGLIALDSLNYPLPINSGAKIQATRGMYVDEIIRRQLPDGGFSLIGETGVEDINYKSDPDITAMAVQALSKYQDRQDVGVVLEKALECLSDLQNNNGGFKSLNGKNSESVAQVIVALGELGIPLDDPRFVKDGKTLLDNLMSFYTRGQGFSHNLDDESNLMATEQALYALVAADRLEKGENSLYNMTDVDIEKPIASLQENPGMGLAGRHSDVEFMPLINPDKTFDDIANHKARLAIEALAERGIISGKTGTNFEPDATMTRAEFATIIVKGLGLKGSKNNVFTDVPSNSWYADMVASAHNYGIVSGITATTFNPSASISRQEAAVMMAKAAKLAGMKISMTDGETRDVLAQFTDYIKASDWARDSLAFCYQSNILSQDSIDIRPGDPIKRYEVAEMLHSMLGGAELL